MCSSSRSVRVTATAPGYFIPQTPEEVARTCRTMIRHGARIIKRAKIIGKYSDEEVLGQMRIELGRPD